MTRLDEGMEGGGWNKNQMKERFFFSLRHLEEVEREREYRKKNKRDGECKRHKEADQRGGACGESGRVRSVER